MCPFISSIFKSAPLYVAMNNTALGAAPGNKASQSSPLFSISRRDHQAEEWGYCFCPGSLAREAVSHLQFRSRDSFQPGMLGLFVDWQVEQLELEQPFHLMLMACRGVQGCAPVQQPLMGTKIDQD